MSKKFIVILSNGEQKLINADKVEILNGVLVLLRENEIIASLNQNRWTDCYENGIWESFAMVIEPRQLENEITQLNTSEVLTNKEDPIKVIEENHHINENESFSEANIEKEKTNAQSSVENLVTETSKVKEENLDVEDKKDTDDVDDLSDLWQEIIKENKLKAQKSNNLDRLEEKAESEITPKETEEASLNSNELSEELETTHEVIENKEEVISSNNLLDDLNDLEITHDGESKEEVISSNNLLDDLNDLEVTNDDENKEEVISSNNLLDDLNDLETTHEVIESKEEVISSNNLLDDLNDLETTNDDENKEEIVSSNNLLDDLNDLEVTHDDENKEEVISSNNLLDDLNDLETTNDDENKEEVVSSNNLLDDLNDLETTHEVIESKEEVISSNNLLDDLNDLETTHEVIESKEEVISSNNLLNDLNDLEVNRKEYEVTTLPEEDENIKSESIAAISERDSIEELLSQLPSENNYKPDFKEGNREIHRVKSPINDDLDALDKAILEKEKQKGNRVVKGEPVMEFRDAPEPERVVKREENPMIRNSQGRLLTPQELKIKKEKIIEQTIGQYCSKFPIFSANKLTTILNKNEKAKPYKITENDIVWVAAKMLRSKDIDLKYFINEHEQKKLGHFLPEILKNQWDGSIANLFESIEDIPQLNSTTLIDLSVWLIKNDFI